MTNLAVYQDSPQTPQQHHPTNLSESHNVNIKQQERASTPISTEMYNQ